MPSRQNSGLLLHVCCAPDATVPWPELIAEGRKVGGFFYGSNIHPPREWRLRRDAVLKFAGIVGGVIEISRYDPDSWMSAARGRHGFPEGGEGCAVCFELQLSAAARFAAARGYDELCSTLTISPHKDPALINGIGTRVSADEGVVWIERVWRKRDGFKISVARSIELGLYRQRYCGCVYSVRE
ncbi:MAG: epoxyqueuosine reductase QueH [Synergistaceae bacterium]|jgi:predicted adenine nucleotide alpha hydrolase (AANH) superfamily ATPase|nr:epoxyqueuosine reductase QueH [Synergistaceae bacterium]